MKGELREYVGKSVQLTLPNGSIYAGTVVKVSYYTLEGKVQAEIDIQTMVGYYSILMVDGTSIRVFG